MIFPDLSSVNATSDLSNLLVYVNTITNGIAMPAVLLAFFFIVLIGSFYAQSRLTGKQRIDVSFVVAGFVTFALALIMSLKTGLLNVIYLVFSLAILMIGVMWIFLGKE